MQPVSGRPHRLIVANDRNGHHRLLARQAGRPAWWSYVLLLLLSFLLFSRPPGSRRDGYPILSSPFWATVCKTVRPMLSDRCLSVCLAVRPVCDVGVFKPTCKILKLAYCQNYTASIRTKFCTVIKTTKCHSYGWSKNAHNKSNMAEGRHLGKVAKSPWSVDSTEGIDFLLGLLTLK